jgi:membrane-associated phospholipid phosphatase
MSRVSQAARRPGGVRWRAGGPRRPLLAPRFRVPAGILTVACALITALLGAGFAGQHSPGRLDRAVDGRLTSALASLNEPLNFIADSTPAAVAVLGVLACCGCLLTHRPRAALLLAVTLPAGYLADIGLKSLVNRTLTGSQSYPSGHTIGAFSLAVIVAVLLLGPCRPPLRPAARVFLTCAAALAACVVPVAMIATGMHYFTDTIGGGALAIALVLATALFIDVTGSSIRLHMLGKGHDRTDSA